MGEFCTDAKKQGCNDLLLGGKQLPQQLTVENRDNYQGVSQKCKTHDRLLQN